MTHAPSPHSPHVFIHSTNNWRVKYTKRQDKCKQKPLNRHPSRQRQIFPAGPSKQQTFFVLFRPIKWMKNNQRLTTSWPQFTGKHTQRNSIRLPTGSVYANFNNSPDGHVPFTRLQSESPRWDSPWNFLL